MTLAPGARLGRYEIVTRLAVGGMAEVWRGVVRGAASFCKPVAIKTLRPELARSRELVDRFVREAMLNVELSHANVVQVFDLGEIEDRYYMSMEYVDGETLRDLHGRLREQRRRAPLWFVLRVMAEVCEALQHVHDLVTPAYPHGVLHHDVSPENIMVTFAGGVKLLDFGAAEPPGTPAADGKTVAKLRYISPERLAGAASDASSDVYSLGVVLFELATGDRPYEGDEPQLARAIVRGEVRDPRRANRELPVPDDIADIIRRAMARDPDDRFPSARAFGEALTRVLATRYTAHAHELGDYVSGCRPSADGDLRDEGQPELAEASPPPGAVPRW